MSDAGLSDFKAYYYASRCLLEHHDAYQEDAFLKTYYGDGGRFSSDRITAKTQRRGIAICVNLPSALFLLTPIALLPWKAAAVVWTVLQFICLIFAAYLAWDLTCFISGPDTHIVSLALLCILTLNCEILLSLGNLAAIVVSLTVVAVWCFLRGRFLLASVVCMAVSLALKPHDTGLIWLYLLFAGAQLRKLALRTLAMACLLGFLGVFSVSRSAPHWLAELHSNVETTGEHGDINDPGPASMGGHTANSIIDMQGVLSHFDDDPHIYNPVTYLICGPLILAVLVTAIQARFSAQRAILAIAAIVPVTMLVTYHRPYDAKLLMLDVPACMLLWNKRGAVGWTALVLTTAGIVLTSDLPLALLTILTRDIPHAPHHTTPVLVSVLMLHPGTLTLLSMAVFYLWMHIQWTESLYKEDPVESERHVA